MNDVGVWRGPIRSGDSETTLAQSRQRQAILILGMHRSGTSALAGVVSALGAAAPKTPLPPNAYNLRGYFESAPLADAHDALLASMGSHWWDWRPLSSDWIGSEAGAKGRQRIKQILLGEFGDEPLIVVKDPRICRFVPFILSVLADMGIRSSAMLPLRNPLEVALSLQVREGIAPSKSVLLWLRHVLDAELHSRSLPRVFISYDNLLIDWRQELDRAAEALGIAWPKRSNCPDDWIDQFLTADLRHQCVSPSQLRDHQDIVALARETYEILSALLAKGEDPRALSRLDRIRARFDEACEIFGPAMAAEQSAIDAVRGQLDTQAAQLDRIRQTSEELAAAHSALTADHNTLVAAQSALTNERDTLAAAQGALTAEHNALVAAQSALTNERDTLVAAHGALTTERDTLAAAYGALTAERDTLAAAHGALIAERDTLAAAHGALSVENNALAAAQRVLSDERDTLAAAHGELTSRHDALGREFAEVSGQRYALSRAYGDAAAERDRLLASRSWRWTAPLRSLRRLLGR